MNETSADLYKPNFLPFLSSRCCITIRLYIVTLVLRLMILEHLTVISPSWTTSSTFKGHKCWLQHCYSFFSSSSTLSLHILKIILIPWSNILSQKLFILSRSGPYSQVTISWTYYFGSVGIVMIFTVMFVFVTIRCLINSIVIFLL